MAISYLVYYNIKGSKTKVINKPPIKKPITAIKDGNCKSDNPLIACPDVQPPAYREPNPTIKPPSAKIKKPFKVNNDSMLNSSSGCADVGADIPNLDKSAMVLSEI